MRKFVAFFVIVALAALLAGCGGQGEQEQKPSEQKTTTTVAESKGIETLSDLYNSKKMVHGTAKVTLQGETTTVEFWYYFDMPNKETLLRYEGEQGGMGKMTAIIKNKYSGTTLTQTMYMKSEKMEAQGCDWIVITQTSTISQSESNIGDEPVEDAFKSTFASQGNVWEYEVETVDYNPSLFQPDGKVCQFSYGS
ncbi:hypothetical protein [Archaeoglobus fulgidus]|uniref:Uncharacterized protein AF_1001 n=3 Tax=Archaeoglobus fulgidus TaxID=2234 RepID=Y1001_ARCFU|nr:hypothetical protein [Archaeoglobus fulgidus]O29261.1 RecName: Full=Uncharacterized protein AF_1001; Flags: Precursor [Archaeoglobus fulgidus DSM 4304]AAB90249.1 predicted coding region AF_1001 [Archaeoglobus fulgidus DSM 4304]AIG97878.1 hypothetical protein AFULGI_00010950 [Archaeoglobus fulgidus DSM 8774]KUJ92575.1 MAG: hypothetical protein XD40_2232 [Archaeoglobus fulgidus]KUK05498.1 MAG: Uncharacterized protein XD48_2268 [Archaeoglobus fulgidus]